MAHTLLGEHHVGAGPLPGIERLYRCPNGYGAIVYQEPPGSEWADRLLVTPVYFEGEDEASYRILSGEEATEGLGSGELTRPKFVFSQEEAERILEELSKLEEER